MTRLACILAALPLLAQPGEPKGQVIDAITKAPISGASIKGKDIQLTANPQGQFNLPAGAVNLRVTHPGYQSVTLTPTETRFTVELTPLAQIAGRVTGPNREPIQGVAVGLRRPWDQAWIQTTVTTEDGRFRIPNLEPGTWILAAIPGMRFSFRDSAKNPKPIPEPGVEEDQRVGWAATFYPNAIDYADAARIPLRPGVSLDGYDIRLRTVTIHRITGVVLDAAGKPAPKALIAISDFANKGSNGAIISANAEGRFEYSAARDGDWRLFAQHKQGEETAKGYADVRVSRADREGVEIRVAQPFPLTGKVEREETRDSEGKRKVTAIYLIPQDASPDVQTETFHEQNGDFVLKRVYPGRYRVLPAGYVPGYYVASIWYGDREVTTETIDVINPPLPLRIIYKSGASRATGTVDRGEGKTVVLIPQDEALRDAHQFIRTAKCAANGRFAIESLRPGAYYAFAFDHVRTEQLEDVDFVRTLTPRALRTEVRPGETATLDLTPQPWPE